MTYERGTWQSYLEHAIWEGADGHPMEVAEFLRAEADSLEEMYSAEPWVWDGCDHCECDNAV